jgi:hypothetical protein
MVGTDTSCSIYLLLANQISVEVGGLGKEGRTGNITLTSPL